MDFLKGLTDYAGELKANVRRPLMELEQEFRKQQMTDALNQVIELDQQRRQALDPQTPLLPTTFNRGDELRMAQQMQLAGIDPSAITRNKIADERLAMFQSARAGIDNPYALANIANELDASPTRFSSGVAYDRFNTEKPILAMTDAVRNDGLSKGFQAKIDEMRVSQLAKMFLDPDVLATVKMDALNNKPITKTERVKVTRDGKEQFDDAILTPTGWIYATAMDSNNQPLMVPSGSGDTTLSKNLKLVADTWKMPAEEALGFLLLSKTKSQSQMRNELYLKAANNPVMAGDMDATNEFVNQMMGAMYPEAESSVPVPSPSPSPSPSTMPTTKPVNNEPPAEEKKAPPKELIAQAVDAINRGADREAVMERLTRNGYTTEGLGL